MRKISRDEKISIIVAPLYYHSGAACYLNALLTYLGLAPVCWDLEYTLQKEAPAVVNLLKETFNTYDSGPTGIDFIRRPLYLLNSLFPGAWESPAFPYRDHEKDLLAQAAPFINKMARKILERRNQTLLFTTLNGNLWFSLLMIQTLRQMGFCGKIIVGGEGISHPRVARLVRELNLIDCVIESRYFQAFADLLDFLGLEKLQPADILALIEQNILHPRLEGFPEPGLDFRGYWSVPNTAKHFIPLYGSFGCRYNCNFCFDSTDLFFRQRSPGSTAREIKRQTQRHGFHLFGFCDSNLNSDPEWLKEFCRILLAENIEAWFTFAHLRADKIDEETIALLQKCRFRNVNLGLESFNDDMCRAMNKGYKSGEDVSTVIDRLAQARIPLSINIFSNYPGHSEGQFQAALKETAGIVARLAKKELLDYVAFSVHPTRLDPHARIYRDSLSRKVRKTPFQLPPSLEYLRAAVTGVMESYPDIDPEQDKIRLTKMRGLVEHIDAKTLMQLTPEMGVLTPGSRVNFKPGVEFQFIPVDDGTGFLDIKSNREDVIRVSETGALIFNLLRQNRSLREITDTLWNRDKGKEAFGREVEKFALGLISEGIAVPLEERL